MRNKIVVGLVLMCIWQSAAANLNGCKGLFYNNQPPSIKNPSISVNKYEICYRDFAVAYSGVAKVGLWSAEVITPQTLDRAAQITRQDNFQEDSRIHAQHMAQLSDYRGSGYDRGHLSPSAQRTSREAQNDSFYLTNIFPQSSKLNQGPWSEIEKATRTFVKKNKQPMYMITGTLFLSPNLKRIGQGVLVPTHVYKAIYVPSMNISGAYVAVNDNTNRIEAVSIAELEQYSGIRFFGGLNKNPIYSLKFNLPMNSNQATRLNIKVQSSSLSNVFGLRPNYLSNYTGPIDYKQNRKEAADLGKGVITDVANGGINIIKGVTK